MNMVLFICLLSSSVVCYDQSIHPYVLYVCKCNNVNQYMLFQRLSFAIHLHYFNIHNTSYDDVMMMMLSADCE